jgi:hypothetical protein
MPAMIKLSFGELVGGGTSGSKIFFDLNIGILGMPQSTFDASHPNMPSGERFGLFRRLFGKKRAILARRTKG